MPAPQGIGRVPRLDLPTLCPCLGCPWKPLLARAGNASRVRGLFLLLDPPGLVLGWSWSHKGPSCRQEEPSVGSRSEKPRCPWPYPDQPTPDGYIPLFHPWVPHAAHLSFLPEPPAPSVTPPASCPGDPRARMKGALWPGVWEPAFSWQGARVLSCCQPSRQACYQELPG